jgi:hypothetical protein
MMILPDTLSRAYRLINTEGTLFDEELASLASVDTEQMAELKMVASAETIGRITSAAKDDEYVWLMKQIATGCPASSAHLETDLRPYHTFADELSTSCGVVFKGHRIVVLRKFRFSNPKIPGPIPYVYPIRAAQSAMASNVDNHRLTIHAVSCCENICII